jgi:hypothetical protein
MPVQFHCQQCHRRLSVTQRKRGTIVNCPKCGRPNLVPQAPSGPVGEAIAESARPPDPESGHVEVVVFDDIPDLIAEPRRPSIPVVQASSSGETTGQRAPSASGESSAIPPQPPSAVSGPPLLWASTVEASGPGASRTSQAVARLKPRPEDAMLLLSRRAVYALAALLLAVSLLAFLAGYLIGRGRRSAPSDAAAAGSAAEVDPVALEGSMIYSAAPGQYKPDAGAAAIALPIDRVPAEKLPSADLHAGDSTDTRWAALANGLSSLGGALARANDDGDFQLVVPQPGEYQVLLISAHARRPKGKGIDAEDLRQLASYFADGAGLIGRGKYVWLRRRLAGVPTPLNHDFGADGK